jgi:methionyl-tRNA formyltransferase
MSKIRVLFLGTPEFARRSLEALIQDEHYQVVGVVTQPDRPRDRMQKLKPSVVAEYAESRGLKVFKPPKLKAPEVLAELIQLKAEIAVVVAYGQIVPQVFLDAFPLGAVNLHGSLLPRWRGAAPIQRALEAGDSETGVVLQKMVYELDAGDLIGTRRIALPIDMDATQLFERLADLGTELLHIEMMDYIRGLLVPVPQAKEGVCYAKKIAKEEAHLNWSQPALTLHNKIRAFTGGPQAFSVFRSKRIKILKSAPLDLSCAGVSPGQLKFKKDSLRVATSDFWLELFLVQPESKKTMKPGEFYQSFQIKEGEKFG